MKTVKDLFTNLEKGKSAEKPQAVQPLITFSVLHSVFPQFATRGEHGIWEQQDANECYNELLRL